MNLSVMIRQTFIQGDLHNYIHIYTCAFCWTTFERRINNRSATQASTETRARESLASVCINQIIF